MMLLSKASSAYYKLVEKAGSTDAGVTPERLLECKKNLAQCYYGDKNFKRAAEVFKEIELWEYSALCYQKAQVYSVTTNLLLYF